MIELNKNYTVPKARDASPNYEPLHCSDTELYMANNKHPKSRFSPEVRGGGFRDVRPPAPVDGADYDSGEASAAP